jgi:ssDNA-binding Zn-finger/Zn-ribbon topoisomerase 1
MAKIASKKLEKSETKKCPDCDSDMEMTRVMRMQGSSGMFWVCTDYKCGARVAKSGLKVDNLELR